MSLKPRACARFSAPFSVRLLAPLRGAPLSTSSGGDMCDAGPFPAGPSLMARNALNTKAIVTIVVAAIAGTPWLCAINPAAVASVAGGHVAARLRAVLHVLVTR